MKTRLNGEYEQVWSYNVDEFEGTYEEMIHSPGYSVYYSPSARERLSMSYSDEDSMICRYLYYSPSPYTPRTLRDFKGMDSRSVHWKSPSYNVNDVIRGKAMSSAQEEEEDHIYWTIDDSDVSYEEIKDEPIYESIQSLQYDTQNLVRKEFTAGEQNNPIKRILSRCKNTLANTPSRQRAPYPQEQKRSCKRTKRKSCNKLIKIGKSAFNMLMMKKKITKKVIFNVSRNYCFSNTLACYLVSSQF